MQRLIRRTQAISSQKRCIVFLTSIHRYTLKGIKKHRIYAISGIDIPLYRYKWGLNVLLWQYISIYSHL